MNKHDINPDLTPKTADMFLLEWVEDVIIDLLPSKSGVEMFFGHPKNSRENFIGIYKKKKLLEIDWSLRPENAESRGYVWVCDSIYDPEAPIGANDNFFEMEAMGYKFGEPANVNIIVNCGVGIYKPLK